MFKNKIWKVAGLIVLVLIFGLGLTYLLWVTKDISLLKPPIEKVLEFKNTQISGWESGKKIWEFYAQEGWTQRRGGVTTFEKVLKGTIFEDDYPLIKGIRANQIKIHRKGKEIEAREILESYIDLGKLKDAGEKEYAFLKADYFKYNSDSKKTEISGNIKIQEEDRVILAQKMIIDHKQNVADILEHPRLTKDDFILTAKKMKAYFKEDRIVAQGNVEVIQKGKVALAQEGFYEGETKRMTLLSEVKAILERGGILLKEESIQKLRNPEAKKLLKEKTLLTADRLTIQVEGRDAWASGKVEVNQKGRSAKAQEAKYIDKDEVIILTSNVLMKKEDEWIKTKKVIVSVRDEAFEAIGEVETEFKLKK